MFLFVWGTSSAPSIYSVFTPDKRRVDHSWKQQMRQFNTADTSHLPIVR